MDLQVSETEVLELLGQQHPEIVRIAVLTVSNRKQGELIRELQAANERLKSTGNSEFWNGEDK
jgi:predicted nuclease of predicted toxin-antitoxin system